MILILRLTNVIVLMVATLKIERLPSPDELRRLRRLKEDLKKIKKLDELDVYGVLKD